MHHEKLALQWRRGKVIGTGAGRTPAPPMVGVCPREETGRLFPHWGNIPVHLVTPGHQDRRDLCRRVAEQCELTRPGHTVLVVSGFNDEPALNEPVLKMMRL